MAHFYSPDLGSDPENPFARDQDDRLVRRSFWLDMSDRSVVLALTQGIGANLTKDQKRAHLSDIRREHLVDDICILGVG
jgi:hypothetical protein